VWDNQSAMCPSMNHFPKEAKLASHLRGNNSEGKRRAVSLHQRKGGMECIFSAFLHFSRVFISKGAEHLENAKFHWSLPITFP
jgi:hypothetical protein